MINVLWNDAIDDFLFRKECMTTLYVLCWLMATIRFCQQLCNDLARSLWFHGFVWLGFLSAVLILQITWKWDEAIAREEGPIRIAQQRQHIVTKSSCATFSMQMWFILPINDQEKSLVVCRPSNNSSNFKANSFQPLSRASFKGLTTKGEPSP